MSLIILSSIINSIKESIENVLSEKYHTANQTIQNNIDLSRGIKNKSKINSLKVQTSTYGKMIPIIYGTMRIAGNIIWMDKIKETIHQNITIKQTPHKATEHLNSTQHQYHVSLAIAISTGYVKEISKIWADSQLLDLSTLTYRFYQGTEDQEPDPLISKITNNTPAYRGIAYVVIENFPLTDYKNHIPNFTFEVTAYPPNYLKQEHITHKIKCIHISGPGEFAYDTKIHMKTFQQKIGSQYIPYGTAQQINNNSTHKKADALISLNQLQNTLPNTVWVSVTVAWYADSLNIQDCNIYPAINLQPNIIITPDDWHVAGINRKTARQLYKNINDTCNYNGTTNDTSLIRYIHELKARGYKVMLYPILQTDTEEKSWIGNLTGDAQNISTFFNNQYNPFIQHYCNLTKNIVDAFIIGSDLIGLTRITDTNNHYPAVHELINLARYVKTQVGSNTIVTYAANWREYHSNNGDYNMDVLWSSQYIDVIGINAYFPLTDTPQPIQGFTEQDIINGWHSGEGYDYFYLYPEKKQDKVFYTQDNNQYAWKNIQQWWNEYHFNQDNSKTIWIPKSKKIWFTQYGFPSIDNCTSQPSIFIDYPEHNTNPTFSKGSIDFYAQKIALIGTITAWHNSDMVEQMFLKEWDARPYPDFPKLQNIWQDAQNWQTGYWIQGKLFLLDISHIIHNILTNIGLQDAKIAIQNVHHAVDGYAITEAESAISILNTLQDIYNFELTEQDDKLVITSNYQPFIHNIPTEDIIFNHKNNYLKITKTKSSNLVNRINFMYLNKNNDYKVSLQYARIPFIQNTIVKNFQIPIVLSNNQAKIITQNLLNKKLNNQYSFYLTLPIKYIWLSINDVIKVQHNNLSFDIKITNISLDNLSMNIEGISNNEISTNHQPLLYENSIIEDTTTIRILDLPCFHNMDNILYFMITRKTTEWKGSIIYSLQDNTEHHKHELSIDIETITGITIDTLGNGPTTIPDTATTLTILLKTGQLNSSTSLFINNNSNLALIGNEIVQFQNVKHIRENIYQISYMLRGRFGTESYVNKHKDRELFILLDSLSYITTSKSLIKKSLMYKVIFNRSSSYGEELIYTYYANNLKPLSVVHVKGMRDIHNNLTITWIRRARINAEWVDNIDTPLDEEIESYDIEILDNQNIIKRTVTVKNSSTFVYSIEQQNIDFKFAQKNINFKIYQNSNTVGRGNVYVATL
ncbi:hypothetical protein EDL79_01455 [Ehrlichia ruminantium]|uniref:GTA TIM-barrel-like domain-containing protein n=1 Tax=Ehrlichia ruminantium TaxID=779 RepID=A0AAE6Q8R5_EHRRU|nr:glycoside hydrolase TIM-barrel-like domain-containing protein [Ehrlichia ruminantium]QGR02345.1 hypothetical protein EDL81_01460 [Ehrlichia ruminantium]QGR03264.1 hypothetical protein EDL80_01455 [Ehrlichia ruminantium]QGR04190.1 hypothetical protein EDL79_01455 [Ehrlichia ruminantium]